MVKHQLNVVGHILFDRRRTIETAPRRSTTYPPLLAVGTHENVVDESFIIQDFNYLTHEWYTLAVLPGFRRHHAIEHVDGFVYVFGGKENGSTQMNKV